MKTHPYLIAACTGLGALALPSMAATSPVTGGDSGQGLTIDTTNFLRALDVGGGGAGQTVQGVLFGAPPDASFSILNLANAAPANFTSTFAFAAAETTPSDLALAEVIKTLAFNNAGLNITLNGLTAGVVYKIDLVQSVGVYNPREQAVLLNGAWQENVLLSSGQVRNTTVVATASPTGQILVTLRPSGSFGGTGPQDGAVLNGIAVTAVSNPDSDTDGLLDAWENGYFPGDLTQLTGSGDFDADGATDLEEFQKATNPTDPDSDDDGLTDGAEIHRMVGGNAAPTNPNSRDSDGDGLFDNEETNTGTYVSQANTGTNPLLVDSDADGAADLLEVLRGSNPNSSASLPPASSPGPLVALDATTLSPGPLTTWTNTGRLARSFSAVSATPAEINTVQGVKSVALNGVATSFVGPAAPSILTGDSSRTIEAWVYNPEIANLESIVGWGRRDGPDGTFSTFSHGTNAGYGAFAGWGPGPDMGWGSVPPKKGRWTYVAFTYDATSHVAKVYADGVLAGQETMTLNTWATDVAGNPLPIRVGGQSGPTGTLVGDGPPTLNIAQVKIHDRALSASELKSGDSDSDGLPDFWETFYGLNPASATDANQDPDGDGVTSLIEYRLGTNPSWQNPDTDADGLFDEWEQAYFRDPLADPAETDAVVLAKQGGSDDADGDTFSNHDEFIGGSNPNDLTSLPTDQDGDGMADAWEIQEFGSTAANPTDDADNDGSWNIDEFRGSTPLESDWATDATDPHSENSQPDTDGNGIGDGWEYTYFAGPASAIPADDPDSDGLTNLQEYNALTDPNLPDTDGDGLTDKQELTRVPAPTNPRLKDSDGDSLDDNVETATGTFTGRMDTGSDPNKADSDLDTYPDGMEIARGSDPNSPTSTPPAYGLMAKWSMNETSGTTAASQPDTTFTGNFGNIASQPVTAAWQPEAGIGGALKRTDSADRVEIPAMNLSYGFTVMAWINPDSETQPAWARLISNHFADGFFLGREGAGNSWKFIVNDDFSIAAGTIVPNQWQHVCGSYDGTTAKLYVNGIEVASHAMQAPRNPIQPVYFGPEGEVDRGFTGLMDEFKIYSGAVPAAEITNIYSQESALLGVASPYDSWASSFGLDPATTGAPGADADHDGTLNQVEYALGLSPVAGSSGFAITVTGKPSTGLTLTWPSKPGISFTVSSGTTPGSFPTTEATLPAAADPATTTSWTTPPFTSGKKFYRVEFTP